jgi:uncharacterized protein (DUF2249 family)
MSAAKPPITPDLSVSELLEAYPELEQPLFELVPDLKKLRSPALLQTVGKLTGLRQAATSAGVELGELISTLRVAAGVEQPWTEGTEAGGPARPEWLAACTEVQTFDARPEIEAGSHPLPRVLEAIGKLERGHALAVVAPFTPTPMIEKVTQMGFVAWTDQKGPAHFVTYFAHA